MARPRALPELQRETPVQSPGVAEPPLDLALANRTLAGVPPERIVAWAAQRFGPRLVLSTSFGIQSAVMLHLATQVVPEIPVIWVDTGYLPPETYRFAEELTRRLGLNLKVYQSSISPARMEALYGRLWRSEDVEDINRYDRLRKVEPMQRALRELGARAWLAGLRAEQTDHRRTLEVVSRQWGRVKVAPILGWSSRDLHHYLQRHSLPYHPLFERGYATVGDWHSSRPLVAADDDARATRFRGLKQECGIHLEDESVAESFDSSRL